MKEVVPPALAGERVDRVVSLLTARSRSQVAELVLAGEVCLDGVPVADRSRRVAAGSVLEVPDPAGEPPPPPLPDSAVTFDVVHADEAVIVVDKPAGLVVHPGAGHAGGTLVSGLLARFPDLGSLAVGPASSRPGLVHRLDKGTSGLLVVGRTPAAVASLQAQLASRSAERRYRGLAGGLVGPDEGLIDAPIGRAPADPTRMAVTTAGKGARTRYRVERRFNDPFPATLLECRLETGRTHQIRVHLAAIGHPLVGDRRYRASGRWPAGVPRLEEGRVWLHAADLAFDHPLTAERVRFSSPLPADLAAVLDALF